MGVTLLLIVASGCQSAADIALARVGGDALPRKLSGGRFELFALEQVDAGSNDLLRVYIGGDGQPWVGGRYVALDPTDFDDPALLLFAQDPGPALYLARPCYFIGAREPACSPALWTSARYGPEVVASLRQALDRELQRRAPAQLVLIGFSGGGVLAMELARLVQMPVFVITVAANLDVAAWIAHHDYLPLRNPVDPASHPERYRDLRQLHLQGELDRNVPPSLTAAYTSRLDADSLRLYPQQDHDCCWQTVWPAILTEKPWVAADGR